MRIDVRASVSRRSVGIVISVAAVALLAADSSPGQTTVTQKSKPGAQLPAISLEIQQFSGESPRWTKEYSETDPSIVRFQAATKATNIGAGRWYVLSDPGDETSIVAQGEGGTFRASDGGAFVTFDIDFRPIVGSNTRRPLSYWVIVIGAERQQLRAPGGSRPQIRAGDRQTGGVGRVTVPAGAARSNQVRVTFVESGPPPTFTLTDLKPELLHTLPISIRLQTLKASGDTDIEPYLLVAAVYADGTTIVPELDMSLGKVRFTKSRVRIQGIGRTHGNVLGGGDMDPGMVDIPSATGHFETIVRPIGLQLANERGLPESEKTKLRKATQVAVVVVGLEEDAVPSTETADQLNREFVAALQAELDGLVRGVVLEAGSTKFPDLSRAVDDIKARLRTALESSARSKTLGELTGYLKFAGTPLLAAFGAANADDYIGTAVAVVTYQELLDGEEAGLPISLDLSNPDEAVKYVVSGRFSIR